MKKRIFALLLIVAVLASTTGNAALIQVGTGFKSGVSLSTPEPTKAPNTVKGLGISGNTTQSTITGSGSAQQAATAEPTAEPTAVPTAEPTAVPTAVPTEVPTAEPTAEPTPMPVIDLTGGTVYTVKGFNEFNVTIKLDEAGNIVFVLVEDHQETPLYGGAVLDDAALFEALRGIYIADAQIDTVAGATLTVNALNDALRQAAEAIGAHSTLEERYGTISTDAIAPVEMPTESLGTQTSLEERYGTIGTVTEEVTEATEEPAEEPAADGEEKKPGKRL